MAKSRSNSLPQKGIVGGAGGAGQSGPGAALAALQVHLLTETSRLFAAPLTFTRVLDEVVSLLAGNLELGSALLLLREEGQSDFTLRAGRGIPRGGRAVVPGNDSLLASLVAGGRPLLVPALTRDRRWRGSALQPLLPVAPGSLLALPLLMRASVCGVLVLTPPAGGSACTEGDVEWLLPVAEQISLALERLLLTRELERAGRALETKVRRRTCELNEVNRALSASLAEVRELRRYSEQIIESLASSLVTFDAQGRVLMVNPPARAILRLVDTPVAGLSLADLFGEAFAAALLRKLGRRLTTIARAQDTVFIGGREEKFVGYSVSPLRRSRTGRTWILLFRDITDARRLENELRRLDRLVSLGEISANVAHELKNPLTVMYANMEWLLEKAPPEFHRRIQITIDHMERMEAIVARMGILSKDQPLAERPLDLCDLVSQMITFVDKTLREKRISAAVSVPAAPLWIHGDPAQLQQALLNIIMNASQAMGENGTLAVRVGRSVQGGQTGVELVVEDSGPGIPAHLLDKIFEPFFTTKETGTGLGLSITSQIVAAHKGRIRAENLPSGGASVRIWFPQSKPAAA